MLSAPAHRGAYADIAAFAPRFVLGRLEGFEKDMNICLTPTTVAGRRKPTHAYFPALAACCGILEYFSALLHGNIDTVGWPQVVAWGTRYLPQPDYNSETIRTLVLAFRNSVNHRGIASGVWRDQRPNRGHRMTWKIHADARRPACQVVGEDGLLTKDPPWPCPYTHRVHIHLKAMQKDIHNGARAFAKELAVNPTLHRPFESCMRQLYPV